MSLKDKNSTINGTFENSFIFGKKGIWDLVFHAGKLKSIKRNNISKKIKYQFIPPFFDSHNHFMGYAVNRISVDLLNAGSIENCKQMISDHVKKEKREFVLAEGWDENYLEEKRLITQKDLDDISKDIPVIARRLDGHISIINTKAKNILEEMRYKVNMEGILLEKLSLNITSIFKYKKDEIIEGFQRAINRSYELGICGVCDFINTTQYEYYNYVLEKIKDFNIFYYIYHPNKIKYHMGSDNLKYKGEKIFADGSIGANTARVSFPYSNSKKRGILLFSDERLKMIIESMLRKNCDISIHAIGDITADRIINIIDGFRCPERFRLEHLEFISKRSLTKIKGSKYRVSMQPNFIGMWGDNGGMYEKKFGKEYIHNNQIMNMYKATQLAFGSDNMPYSPSYGIYWAMKHPDKEQRMTLEDAIKCYTFNSYDIANMKIDFIKKGTKVNALIYKGEIKNTNENFLDPDITILNGEIKYEKN